jgi:hypothetical protein
MPIAKNHVVPIVSAAGKAYARRFEFTMITNNPLIAAGADRAGVDHIGLDFETLGKRKRQPDKAEWVSDHKIEEVSAVRGVLRHAKLFARVDPIHGDSPQQINTLLDLGVNSMMLPMFTSAAEVEKFVNLVAGRAYVTLLLETAQAVKCVDDILRVQGIDEVTIGLNDLHRDLGKKSHFEILTSDLMLTLSEKVRAKSIRFGFGTLAKTSDVHLPVSPDLICAQYPRLEATTCRLHRYFLGKQPLELDFDLEVKNLRMQLAYWHDQGPKRWEQAKRSLVEIFDNWSAR